MILEIFVVIFIGAGVLGGLMLALRSDIRAMEEYEE